MKGTFRGNELRYDTGVFCEFNNEELLRLKSVFAHVRTPYEKQNVEVLPWQMKDFSVAQRRLWAEIMGDKEVIRIFGDGPWTQEASKAVAKARWLRRKGVKLT